jgi:hypothetical protein
MIPLLSLMILNSSLNGTHVVASEANRLFSFNETGKCQLTFLPRGRLIVAKSNSKLSQADLEREKSSDHNSISKNKHPIQYLSAHLFSHKYNGCPKCRQSPCETCCKKSLYYRMKVLQGIYYPFKTRLAWFLPLLASCSGHWEGPNLCRTSPCALVSLLQELGHERRGITATHRITGDGPSPRNSESHDSCSTSSLRIARDRS